MRDAQRVGVTSECGSDRTRACEGYVRALDYKHILHEDTSVNWRV